MAVVFPRWKHDHHLGADVYFVFVSRQEKQPVFDSIATALLLTVLSKYATSLFCKCIFAFVGQNDSHKYN